MKLNHLFNTVLYRIILQLLWLLVLLAVTGCGAMQPAYSNAPELMDGQIISIYQGTAQQVVDAFFNGQALARAYIRDGFPTIFAKPLNGGWAWVCLDGNLWDDCVSVAKSGNLANYKTFSDFRQWLISSGWQEWVSFPVLLDAARHALSATSMTIPVMFYAPDSTAVPEWLLVPVERD